MLRVCTYLLSFLVFCLVRLATGGLLCVLRLQDAALRCVLLLLLFCVVCCAVLRCVALCCVALPCPARSLAGKDALCAATLLSSSQTAFQRKQLPYVYARPQTKVLGV